MASTDIPYLVNFDPVAFSLGPLQVHWYGLMYMAAFAAFWWFGRWKAGHQKWWGWQPAEVGDFLFYGMLGVILGGRVGYVLIYGLANLKQDWLFLFKIWEGGMSFHGGLVGVLAATYWYARQTGRGFWQVGDFIAPMVPLGLMLGRLGNFIGGELWGRKTESIFGMLFPNAVSPAVWAGEHASLAQAHAAGALNAEARHPSQLYQAGLEGLALFLILWWFSSRQRPTRSISGLFLIGYGLFRILVEFVREPDAHLRFIAFDWLTMGQLLSLPMVAFGIYLMATAHDKKQA